MIAFFTSDTQEDVDFTLYKQIECSEDVLQLKNTWDIFSLNDKAIKADFGLITQGRTSQPIPEGVHAINKENIFIEEGATISFSSLNASKGPIYIGKDAEIMEGCLVRGPFAMCEHSVLKMGAKVYGATTSTDTSTTTRLGTAKEFVEDERKKIEGAGFQWPVVGFSCTNQTKYYNVEGILLTGADETVNEPTFTQCRMGTNKADAFSFVIEGTAVKTWDQFKTKFSKDPASKNWK